MSRWRCWPNQGSREIDFARGTASELRCFVFGVGGLCEGDLTEFSFAVEG